MNRRAQPLNPDVSKREAPERKKCPAHVPTLPPLRGSDDSHVAYSQGLRAPWLCDSRPSGADAW